MENESQDKVDVLFQVVDGEKACSTPSRGSAQSAGWDLYAAEDTVLQPFTPKLVPTNLRIQIPEDYVLFVMQRSSMALKRNIYVANAPGVVDADYRGPVGVILVYQPTPGTADPSVIKKGERIAQAVVQKYSQQHWLMVSHMAGTERGDGGFGSTGK